MPQIGDIETCKVIKPDGSIHDVKLRVIGVAATQPAAATPDPEPAAAPDPAA